MLRAWFAQGHAFTHIFLPQVAARQLLGKDDIDVHFAGDNSARVTVLVLDALSERQPFPLARALNREAKGTF